MFGGNSDVSNAQATAAINSSGWTVGGGRSSGGGLTSNSGGGLPWYAWASIGAVALYWWRMKNKRGKHG